MQYQWTNLESRVWTPEIGTSINSVLADRITPTYINNALKMTNESTLANGGGLLTCKLPFPSFLSLAGFTAPSKWYIGLDLNVRVSSFDLPLLGRLECDLITVATDGSQAAAPGLANKANMSTQWNQSEGGMWQRDVNLTWTDTGIKSTLTPDTWIAISERGLMDLGAGQFTYLSLAVGGASPVAPANSAPLAFQTSNWQPVIAIQLQTEVLLPGAMDTEYYGITVTLSDEEF